MKRVPRKGIVGMLFCLLLGGCSGYAATDGEKEYERFLGKTAAILGEDYWQYLDYRIAAEEFRESCENGSTSTFEEASEKPMDAAVEGKVLRAKKALYEALAEKNKMDIIPARISFRCALTDEKPNALIEAVYEEEEEEKI